MAAEQPAHCHPPAASCATAAFAASAAQNLRRRFLASNRRFDYNRDMNRRNREDGATMDRVITIERHILQQEKRHPEATGVLTQILYDIALAGKLVSRETTRAGLADILGLTGSMNVQGEQVAQLDEFADAAIIRRLSITGGLGRRGSPAPRLLRGEIEYSHVILRRYFPARFHLLYPAYLWLAVSRTVQQVRGARPGASRLACVMELASNVIPEVLRALSRRDRRGGGRTQGGEGAR